MQDADPEGEIKFSHTPIIDIHGNPSIPIKKKYTEVTIDTTLNFENGNRFSGNWKYGNINGFGHYTWDGIGTYKGNWLDGKKHGKGTMVWDDGSRYEGNWTLDEFSGDGTYYYNNGDIYVGNWRKWEKTRKRNLFLKIWIIPMKVYGLITNFNKCWSYDNEKWRKMGCKSILTYLINFDIIYNIKRFCKLSLRYSFVMNQYQFSQIFY